MIADRLVTALEVFAACLIVAGVWFMWPPAALVCAGVLILLGSWLVAE